jgi:ribonuclease D
MSRIKPPSKEESALLPAYAGLPDSAIHVPQTDADFALARQHLLAAPVLGFDTESKPIFHSSQPDTGPHVVQLATESQAWLLQLHHPQAMELARAVLANAHICKPGFGLDNDRQALPRKLGVELHNILDLDRIFKHHGYGASVGVRAAVALVLGEHFHKSKKTSTSNWAARQLSESQRRYAANDAHAAVRIHAALADWENRQPPVPAKASRARPKARPQP